MSWKDNAKMQPIYFYSVKEIVKVRATNDFIEIKSRFFRDNLEHYTDQDGKEYKQTELIDIRGNTKR